MNTANDTILVVDDNPANLRLLRTLLAEHGYAVRLATNGMMALTSARAEPPDVILLDIEMPDFDGYEVCTQLKADPNTWDIPVLFISAASEALDKVKAFAAGGVDYIPKPFQMEEVLARIQTHLALSRLQRQLREANETLEQKVAERTERLSKANAALSKSEARFRLTIESALDAIIVIDDQSIITEWNPQAEAIFGWQRTEAIGRAFFGWQRAEAGGRALIETVVPAADHQAHLNGLRHFLATGQGLLLNQRVETTARHRDGHHFPVELTISPLRHGDQWSFSAFVRDITERKRAETEREAFIQELETKNAELERYAYTVSHDLKNPLVTIKGFLGLLKKDIGAGNTERVEHDIKQINSAAEKMHRLLEDLLELSRIGRLMNSSEAVSLADLAQEAIELVAGRIAADGVTVEIASALPVGFGDRVRLLEVIQNLVENAVKFMGDQPEPHVKIGGYQEGNHVVCYVRDNGMGIAPRYHEKIFGLFDRLDQKTEGTGIGLALAKRIVEVHGGQIWVESEGEGYGSTFYFSLPRQPMPLPSDSEQ